MRLLLFTLIALHSFAAYAQHGWQRVNDFPGIARDDAAGVVCHGTGYMGTGFGAGFIFLNDWWKYDFAADTWSPLSSLPAEARQYTAIATLDNDIYLLGGITPSGHSDELWVYHTLSDTWTLAGHIPGGGRQAPVLAAYNHKLYAGLGRNTAGYFSDWWEFDPAQLTWMALTPFPGQARFDPLHAVVNESVVVGAGVSATGGENDCYAYSVIDHSWKQLNSFPGCSNFYTVQLVYQNNIYLAGGADAGYGFCGDAYIYDAGYFGGWWQWQVAPLNPVRRGGVGFVHQNRFYYACGLDSASNRLNRVEYVQLETGSQSENQFMVYPTMAQDYIVVESKTGTDFQSSIALYNIAGQPMPLHFGAAFAQYARLDVSLLAPGVYILRITGSSDKSAAYKFVKTGR